MLKPQLGATVLEDGRVRVAIWAPFARSVRLRLGNDDLAQVIDLVCRLDGYAYVETSRLKVGDIYQVSIDDSPWIPDPASRSLPTGVHGSTEVVDLSYSWTDSHWKGIEASELVIYELHIGTFTEEGTFDAAIRHLDRLAHMGITAIEIMPLAEVPGQSDTRNWGYDGVQLFAVRRDYGGIAGLHRFVDACHDRKIAVILDVVYNHLGPEGNYLRFFGPYHTDVYQTPWGEALNFDGPHSDDVRHYFLTHAAECLEVHHLDGLRIDAAPYIFDRSAIPFLSELSEKIGGLSQGLARPLHLIAEADDNNPQWVKPRAEGGVGLQAMWADDIHHALHAWFTKENHGFYADFGTVQQVARAFCQGAVLDGEYSEFRRRRWGGDLRGIVPTALVTFLQNHDRVGNRPDGARLSSLISPEAYRVATTLSLLTPTIPLLFMGQEYGEHRPFYFFTSFDDSQVVKALRKGRAEVFTEYGGGILPPDPQDKSTKALSCLGHEYNTPEGQALVRLHHDLLKLRRVFAGRKIPLLRELSENQGFFEAWWPGGYSMWVYLKEFSESNSHPAHPIVFDTDRYRVRSPEAADSGAVHGEAAVTKGLIEGPRVIVYGPAVEGDM